MLLTRKAGFPLNATHATQRT